MAAGDFLARQTISHWAETDMRRDLLPRHPPIASRTLPIRPRLVVFPTQQLGFEKRSSSLEAEGTAKKPD